MAEEIQDLIDELESVLDQLDILNETLKNNPSANSSLFVTELTNIHTNFYNKHDNLKVSIKEVKDSTDYRSKLSILSKKFASSYYTALASIPSNEVKPVVSAAPAAVNTNLTRISIPKFDGNIKNYQGYISIFNSLIHENEYLSSITKFQYLLNSLSGSALSVISSLAITPENYAIAYKAIVNRFSNPRRLASFYFSELMNFSKPAKPTFESYQQFLSTHTNAVAALSNLNIDLKDFLLFSLTYNNLDIVTKSMFEAKISSSEVPTYQSLIDFVTDKLRATELLEFHPASSITAKPANASPNRSSTAAVSSGNSPHHRKQSPVLQRRSFVMEAHTSPSASPRACFYCQSPSHSIFACTDFLLLSVADRHASISKLRRCFSCFGAHPRKLCKSAKSCQTCGLQTHNTLLHPYTAPSQSTAGIRSVSSDSSTMSPSPSIYTPRPSDSSQVISPPSPASSSLPPRSVSTVNNSASNHNKSDNQFVNMSCKSSSANVLLGTAIIHAVDKHGNRIALRAILDSGSQASLITQRGLRKLGLVMSRSAAQLVGVTSNSTPILGTTNFRFSSRINPDWATSCNALIVKEIIGRLPSSQLPNEVIFRFNPHQLADPEFGQSAFIDVLLGADIFSEIVLHERPMIPGHPAALQTTLGLVVFGKVVENSSSPSVNSSSVINVVSVNPNVAHSLLVTTSTLDQHLQRFWELEEVEPVVIRNPLDEKCETLFQSTTTRTPEGRYVVALPFKDNPAVLQSTMSFAERSLKRMELRFSRNPALRQQYHAFMSDYINLNHMSLACVNTPYIIPHHVVLKESSSTTRVRTVFNGSFCDSNGQSLNQQLLPGPKLQKDICSILISFRLHRVAVCSDLRMMYRQILVRPRDCAHQHIVYRADPATPIQEFELRTVTYGLTPSAYLAQRTLLQLVEDEGSSFPLASHAVANHSYVDDILSGADSVSTAKLLISELIELFKKGCFELRKWSSSHPELLTRFSSEYLENPLLFSEESPSIKVLGLKWTPKNDEFAYDITEFCATPTKRSILSYIARTFDPLGFLTPITFWIKLFLQRLWHADLDWDSPLPESLLQQWQSFSVKLPQIRTLRIPRCLFSQSRSYRLVGFSDASQAGYAAIMYLVSYDELACSVHLLKAKSRVATLKTVTIPRLELCGALLLAKLFHSVKACFDDFTMLEPRLFTDATIVLSWLNTPPHLLKIFVANRVTNVLSLTTVDMWSHVSSADNPADVASRGSSPEELISSDLWWKGPNFLLSDLRSWQSNISLLSPAEVPELRFTSPVIAVAKEEPSEDWLSRFSSYSRMLRVISYVLRFVNHTRRSSNRHTTLVLTVTELQNALHACVRFTQRSFFASDLKAVRSNQPVSKPLLSLTPFIDTHNLLRVGGRLKHSSLPTSQRNPLLLPKDCHLSRLICDHFHRISLHTGPRTTQAFIQRQFWILSLRSLLRWRIFHCVTCRRYDASPSQPLMSDLPACRVQMSRPFSSVGVDFAGPFDVRLPGSRVSKSAKGYLAIFVCMSVKAVHLEFVSDLSTAAFLASFDRFVSRRGLPSDVYSDNGTNFVGADRHLRQVYALLASSSDDISSSLANRGITWHFNPPSSPNFGGLWEANVKSAKNLLKRTVGDQSLNFEEYATLFARIEGILNSRPLFEPSPDPSEQVLLTPAHFLVGSPLNQVPETPVSERLSLRSRWLLLRQLLQRFWKLWSDSYLQTQIQRHKWNKSTSSPTVGQIVILKNNSFGPAKWPLGRIVALFPGKDNISRVAEVKTQHGNFVRPVNKLVPLPDV